MKKTLATIAKMRPMRMSIHLHPVFSLDLQSLMSSKMSTLIFAALPISHRDGNALSLTLNMSSLCVRIPLFIECVFFSSTSNKKTKCIDE